MAATTTTTTTTSYTMSQQPQQPVTTEPVGYYKRQSVSSLSSSSSSSSSNSSTSVTNSLKRLILILICGVLFYLLLSIIYQAMQTIFSATDLANENAVSGNPQEIQAFLDSHPPNRFGLWRQCNDKTGCGELQVWCNPDDIRKRLADGGLLAKATPDEANDFVNEEAKLCPLFVGSRSTSIISILTACLALIGLLVAFRRNSRAAFTTATIGAFLTTCLTAATLGMLATIKAILDNISHLGAKYSNIGSNTTNPFVNTNYLYLSGFWLVLVTFLVSLLLLPLFFIVSHQARNYRLEHDEYAYNNKGGDYYDSSFSFDSVDGGPQLPPKGSKEPLKETEYFSTQNVTYSTTPGNVNYEYPPMTGVTQQRIVRFDGSQAGSVSTTDAPTPVITTTKTTVTKKEIIKE